MTKLPFSKATSSNWQSKPQSQSSLHTSRPSVSAAATILGVVLQTWKVPEVSHQHPTFPASLIVKGKIKQRKKITESQWCRMSWQLLPSFSSQPAAFAHPQAPKHKQFKTRHPGTRSRNPRLTYGYPRPGDQRPLARDGKVKNNAVTPQTGCKMELWFSSSVNNTPLLLLLAQLLLRWD